MLGFIYASMNDHKKECSFAYKVAFLKPPFSFEDVVLNPLVSFRGHKLYTFLSRVECPLGSLALTLSRQPHGLVPSVAVVVERLEVKEARMDERVGSPTTGFIIGNCTYPLTLKSMMEREEQKNKSLEELIKLINLEKEKVLLSQVASANPELAAKIDAFRSLYPDTPIMGGCYAPSNS